MINSEFSDDNKIIEMLERCLNGSDCDNCDYVDNCACKEYLLQDAIDTINHQKAEINRLNKEVDRLSQCVLYHDGQIVDAIKEFAERLIDKVGFNSSIVDVYEYIDDLVKEMVGEQG